MRAGSEKGKSLHWLHRPPSGDHETLESTSRAEEEEERSLGAVQETDEHLHCIKDAPF